MSDEARRLSDWRLLEGLPRGFPLDVHPRDEMLPGVSVPSRERAGRERLSYLRAGQQAVHVLENAVSAFGGGLAAPARVLELACGYGRVTRHLVGRVERERLVTSEIVPEAVAHVARAFDVTCVASQADPARVAWPGAFDVVFVASLFSHLPRPRFLAWLERLRGALAPGGLLVLSTHGLWMPEAPPPDPRGMAFLPSSESLALAGAEYGTTFVAPEEVARLAREAGFAGAAWRERELWALQDVFVLGAEPLRPAHAWRPAPILEGAIDGLQAGGAGTPSAAGSAGVVVSAGVAGAPRAGRPGGGREVWVHGWAECRDPDRPVERATLHLDGLPAGDALLQPARREERPPPRPARRSVAEWHLHAVLPEGLTGRHTLALVVEAGGERRCLDVRTLDADAARLTDGAGV